MATFVLVHGGYQGGWCWRKVTPLLQGAGHEVFTPTLTGLGERAHLLAPSVNLSTHIQDIINVLYFEDLQDVILVGHSYAGIVIAGVTEAAPELLGRLVFLDAVIPDDGQSFFDTVSAEVGERWQVSAVELAGTRVYPPSSAHWPLFLNACQVTDPDDVAWAEPRLTPHPLATMEEPVRLSPGHVARVKGSLIRCSEFPEDEATDNEVAKGKAVANGWDYYEIQSAHEAMITAPRELAALLSWIATDHRAHT